MNATDFGALYRFVGETTVLPSDDPGKRLLLKCIPHGRREAILLWLQDAARAGETFEFNGRICRVNGVPIPYRSPRPLALAWIVMAARQYGLGAIKTAWFPASGHSLAQAVRRSAGTVERYSPPLAGILRSFRHSNGEFIIQARDVPIRCISPTLARAVLA
jgi:hypothetical protein